MKILIATPCYGGQATVPYIASLLTTTNRLRDEGVSTELNLQYGESLIPRGRNTAAMYALEKGFDKLLFIDADIGWDYEDVRRIVFSDKKIIGGIYPLKTFPITMNFNPLDEQRDLYGFERRQDNYIAWVKKYADPETGEAEVAHIPTGFMQIDCSVLASLSYRVPAYTLFAPEKGTKEPYFDFFQIGVVSGEYRSEDWAFCDIARKFGFKVYLQTRSVVRHHGFQQYYLGQHEVVSGQKVNIEQLTKTEKAI